MNLGNYIRSLLPEHDTVIIPGLGAFITRYKPAQIDEKSGEMKPPSKEVLFEPKIRNNDGLLAGKIAHEEGIALTEAYRKLENEREEIVYLLDKGEKVTLEELGVIWYDNNNDLRFSPSGKDIMLLDAYGLEEEPIRNEPIKEPEEDKTQEDTSGGNNQTQDPFKEEVPPVYAEATLKDAGTPPGRSSKAWWLLLFLIPILGGAIYIFTRQPETVPPTEEPVSATPNPETAVPIADTARQDTLPIEPSPVNAVPDTTTRNDGMQDTANIITPDTTKYYLISGSFEDYENAQKFVRRLSQEGYQPFHLGKHGSFYLVGVNTFDNPTEAYGEQYNYLDKHPESGAWIFAPGKSNSPNP